MAALGAHVSTAGGMAKAFDRGADIGCDAIQVFVKSPNQWRARPLDPQEVESFRARSVEAGWPLVAHAAYLINLASADEEIAAKSRAGLKDEFTRCGLLGIGGLVFHPGAHLGAGIEAGIEAIARNIDAVLAESEGVDTFLLLENTAGQGSTVGARFEELAGIIALLDQPGRVGVCLDTCHAFSAGYDVSTEAGHEALLAEFDRHLGLARLRCVHLNDSKHPLGSRKDRHENIGVGLIGEDAFARIINDPRLAHAPQVLETPLGDDDDGHRRDLALLRTLITR